MPTEVWGIIALFIMLILMFLGLHNATVFFTLGIVGAGLLVGWGAVGGMVREGVWAIINRFEWTVIPLFFMMGIILSETGIGQDIFSAMRAWLGHIRSGLATATCAACAALGTMSGSGWAISALMAKIAYPEMRRYNYQPGLALGVSAAAGSIALMIPPSMSIVTYAILAETSISDTLLAGFIPGVLSMIEFAAIIYIRSLLNPTLCPPAPASSWAVRFGSLKFLIPVLIMVIVITGGISYGVMSPSEAAGIGAFTSFAIAIAMRRLNMKRLKAVIAESARMTVMLMGTLVASQAFYVRFLNQTGVTLSFANLAMAIPSPWVTIALMIVIWFIFGMFIGGTLAYVTIPLFAPIASALGFNLVWLGIVSIKMMEVGGISPPVCMNTFIVQGIVGEVPMETAYNSAWFFVWLELAMAAIIIVWPDMVLWLPRFASSRGQ